MELFLENCSNRIDVESDFQIWHIIVTLFTQAHFIVYCFAFMNLLHSLFAAMHHFELRLSLKIRHSLWYFPASNGYICIVCWHKCSFLPKMRNRTHWNTNYGLYLLPRTQNLSKILVNDANASIQNSPRAPSTIQPHRTDRINNAHMTDYGWWWWF